MWRTKVGDNLISRRNQNGSVVRLVRSGYWFERDAPKQAQRLESTCPPAMERRAEGKALKQNTCSFREIDWTVIFGKKLFSQQFSISTNISNDVYGLAVFASAFGWHRCWEANISLLVDPSDFKSASRRHWSRLGRS
jgi:hypothetical protein